MDSGCVQEVIIEYADGPETSKSGGQRVANGHPEPFNLKYLEIGDANTFQMNGIAAAIRFFIKQLKTKYPDISAYC